LRRCFASLSLYDRLVLLSQEWRGPFRVINDVPEMECAVRTGCRKGSKGGMEGYGVDAINICDASGGGFTVAFKGKVHTIEFVSNTIGVTIIPPTHLAFLSSTYWIAHLPSILPTANPEASGKQLTTRVCHFSGLWMVLKIVVGLARLITLI